MTRQMKHFNFPVRNLDGTFYAQVHPFDPSYFAVKVHSTGALLFTPHHSQLTLLQHIIIQSPFSKQPVQLLSEPFFCCERLSASMARSLHLSFICIPQSTRALDQGGVEPRQAVSPKALRPWTIPLRYSVGYSSSLSQWNKVANVASMQTLRPILSLAFGLGFCCPHQRSSTKQTTFGKRCHHLCGHGIGARIKLRTSRVPVVPKLRMDGWTGKLMECSMIYSISREPTSISKLLRLPRFRR